MGHVQVVIAAVVHNFLRFSGSRLFATIQFMHTKVLILALAIGLAGNCTIKAQSPSPAESPSPKKHRTHKKAEPAASPAEQAASPSTAESPAASPKPKRARKKQAEAAATTSASPAVSPEAKRTRKKRMTEAVASPAAASPSASPRKSALSDFFKPKSSVSTSPAAAPVTTAPGATTPAPGGGPGLVWVNTETHVYHKEGSRFYGTTKKGKYVSEADAMKEGDRAAAKGH